MPCPPAPRAAFALPLLARSLAALGLALLCAAFVLPGANATGASMDMGASAAVVVASSESATATSAEVVMTCDRVCVAGPQQLCLGMAALTTGSGLALLLVLRRRAADPVLRRFGVDASRRVERGRSPWTVLSPFQLCVVRV